MDFTVQTAEDSNFDEHVKKVEKAIQNVRYLSMDTGEICQLDLFSFEQRIAIIYKKVRPNATDMAFPSGLSLNKTTRNYTTTCIKCKKLLPPHRSCCNIQH